MRLYFLAAFTAFFFVGTASGQQKWNLKTIVEYSMANNIGVKQADLQARFAALTHNQSRLSQYPSANFNGSTSLNSGSNQDPATFSRITQTYLAAGLQLQTNADIFNFYSKKNAILANEWELKAAMANVGKIKNDIALSAANAYLQILLSIEQEKITLVQLEQTRAQLNNTRKQVDAGALPELNALQLEAQLAQDTVNYITTKGNTTQAILSLKSLMNIDAAAAFEVDVPPVESIPVDPIADLQPEYVFNQALANQPQQLYNEYKLKAAEKNLLSARGAMYPTVGAFASLGSTYNNKVRQAIPGEPILLPFGNVVVGGTSYQVYPVEPFKNYTYSKRNFPNQLSDNFRQSIGLTLGVPILNGGSLRTGYERSKLTISSLQLQKEQDNQKLKQDIYAAYTAAVIALEKFSASQKAVSSAEQTYLFAGKRFNVGMLSTFDLITTQNNVLRAKLEYTINRFDYVFKMKVLEFYKGLGLKL
jgi:outer membrane protein